MKIELCEKYKFTKTNIGNMWKNINLQGLKLKVEECETIFKCKFVEVKIGNRIMWTILNQQKSSHVCIMHKIYDSIWYDLLFPWVSELRGIRASLGPLDPGLWLALWSTGVVL